MKLFVVILFSSTSAFAQVMTTQLPTVEIGSQKYFHAVSPDQEQIFIKQRTEKSDPIESEPTVANEYGRLGIFNFEGGIGWQNFSERNWYYTKNGQFGKVGDLEGNRETINSLPYGLAIDLGGSVRPPLKYLDHLSVGAMTTILVTECHPGTNSPVKNPDPAYPEGVIEVPKYAFSTQCPESLIDFLTRNWTAYSTIDVLVFKGNRSTKSLSLGAFIEGTGADHYVGDQSLGFQRTYQRGAVLSVGQLGNNGGGPERTVGHDWKVTAYIGGRGNLRITIGRSVSLSGKRVNPPTRVEK